MWKGERKSRTVKKYKCNMLPGFLQVKLHNQTYYRACMCDVNELNLLLTKSYTQLAFGQPEANDYEISSS